jgi:hypothetical protein
MPKNPTPEPIPDPERWKAEVDAIADDHDPSLEPWASMSRDQIEAAMDAEADPMRWLFLEQYLLDRCTKAELERINFANALSAWLIDEKDARGNDQIMHVVKVAAEATRALFEDMPPPGPLHQIN